MTTRITARLATLSILITLSTNSATIAAPDSGDQAGEAKRTIRHAEGFSAERTEDELRDTLLVEDFESESRAIVTKPRRTDSTVASVSAGEFWIYSATTELFFDDDGDGYYHYLRVTFDADTLFSDAYVYAELYLSWDGETWERYFVSEDFLIQGSTSLDEYEVETEFVSGYPTGLYDVLIELYDADFGEFVDEFGPLQSSDFSILPIEDLEHDGVPPPVVISHEHGGAGSISWAVLVVLAALILGRRRARNAR